MSQQQEKIYFFLYVWTYEGTWAALDSASCMWCYKLLWTVVAVYGLTNMIGKKMGLLGTIRLEVDKHNPEFYMELHQ